MRFNMIADAVPQESLAALQQEVQDNLEQLKPNVLLDTIKGWNAFPSSLLALKFY